MDDWKQAVVNTGDNLALIFSRHGVNAGDLHKVMTLGAAVNTLKRIHPGQVLHLRADAEGRLLELRYEESPTLGLHVTRDGDQFAATSIHRIPDRQTAHASAVIDSSLFMAGQKAKLADNLIMDLAGIFGWDVDFALDIREGDRFHGALRTALSGRRAHRRRPYHRGRIRQSGPRLPGRAVYRCGGPYRLLHPGRP